MNRIIRRFLADTQANYILMTAIAVVPIMGGLALAIDYTELSSQRQATLNALDAAGVATARRIVEGATDTQARAYAEEFFKANLGSVNPANATLTITLPSNSVGGGTLKLAAEMRYQPNFLPVAAMLIGKGNSEQRLNFSASSEVRLKNTLEVALVLDNSGSMDYIGKASNKKRIDLLKDAAKQLVDTIALQGQQMKQVEKPVQFGIVPFAASVNIGSGKATEPWMDQDGISPIHHENFDWSTFNFAKKKVQKVGNIWYKKGTDWGAAENQKMTRFQLYADIQRITGYTFVKTGTETYCSAKKKNGDCKTWSTRDVGYDAPNYGPYASWGGCVEARPSPYNTTDDPAVSSDPATMFVPMFSPDETDLKDGSNRRAESNWWTDVTSSSNNWTRETYMPKYYTPYETDAAAGSAGPNASCTTTPITPLTDVTKQAGLNIVKGAIDAMAPNGATNVPEGLAWGWRVISGGAPFTEGRADTERGNDKVLIVLTDGANTYYTPSSLGYNDLAGNKSTYSAYGYAGRNTPGYSNPRIFLDTPSSITKTDYSNANYTKALNAQFDTLCTNAKNAGVILMTVSLDLNEKDTTEKAQMDALKACASYSRFRKDPSDSSKADKNYWNTNGGDLSETFRKIADELSNLRIIG